MESIKEDFIPSVLAYHRAMATGRYGDALDYAKAAVRSAPCDSEAAHWYAQVKYLENKTAKGLDKVLRTLGFGGA